MTARAFLWCGHARPPRVDRKGRAVHNAYDYLASRNDIAIAIRAARSLGIADRDIHPFLCDDGLLPPDFNERIHDATAAELSRVVQGLRSRAAPDDPLLFVASNHAEEEGLLMTTHLDELADGAPLHLTPRVLAECLSSFTGPQVVLVATCHSGAFLSLGGRADRLVITACDAHEKYLVVGDEEDAHSPVLRVLLGAWCGVAPGDHAAPALLPLDDAFAAARAFEMGRTDLAASKRTEPLRNGSVRWPDHG